MSEILTFGQWSTQKVKVNWSRVKVNGYMARVGFGFPVRSRIGLPETLTHPDDMALTWTRADVANDVSRAHGQIRVVRVGSIRVNGQLGDVVLTRRHC